MWQYGRDIDFNMIVSLSRLCSDLVSNDSGVFADKMFYKRENNYQTSDIKKLWRKKKKKKMASVL